MKACLFNLKFLTPNGIRIGTKIEGENTIYALKFRDKYVIPSTSWKGMFRRITESVSQSAKYIYGYHDEKESLAGAITISDSLIDAKSVVRPHVTIDRKSKTNLEKSLFSEEIVLTPVVNVKVILRGDDEIFNGWKETLRYLRDLGYFIGQGKSRGIGYIRLDDKESEYAYVSVEEKPKFRSLAEFLGTNE
ncbi:RAMP superfamily CRISPR-associated protein [Acidianus manzaensis]|uniref:CRISPR type III-associated protein domain-containing protein n=1 Tax=Acidianus manzaensis TaxID=282676 RepID=A0A1W6JWG4_9CREN|nr:RAMP superfamily CRISPR-associated protein [Acidianus manzaensis]ARM74570.1 hypothetical protein B6F84_00010 [Acidianus manzaensis]